MSDAGGYDGYDGYSDDGSTPGAGGPGAKVVVNQPHDEEVNLTDEDSDGGSQRSSTAELKKTLQRGEEGAGMGMGGDGDGDLSDPESAEESPTLGGAQLKSRKLSGMESKSENSSDDEGNGEKGGNVEGVGPSGYNPEDYADLKVSEEIQELFRYIGRYKPQSHQLDTKLKPFIPDYIPAVGDIDEFIKVARPDGKTDDLGLKMLDEPAAKQSDPTVLNLQLRQVSKQANLKPVEVTSVEAVDKSDQVRKIATWIQSIAELHKNKPRPVIAYTKNMPEIEDLMQEWPPEVEDALRHHMLPDETLDLSMPDYIKVMCNILDIPVYQNPVESLHIMLTLYLEFKNNPFLAKGHLAGAPVGMGGMSMDAGSNSLMF